MGRTTQRQDYSKLDSALFISQVKEAPSPKVDLEQYLVSESIASTMLYLATYTYGDIINKVVLDLGCGTGRLSLGACFLGAKSVVGIDIDRTVVKLASKNSKKTRLHNKVQWVSGDIGAVRGRFDTVLQNPPFGIQKRTADCKFLEKAMEVGDTVYSLHNHPSADEQLVRRLKANSSGLVAVSPSPFIKELIENHNGSVKAVYAMLMTIPRMFDFHKKTKYEFAVDLYIIKTGKNRNSA